MEGNQDGFGVGWNNEEGIMVNCLTGNQEPGWKGIRTVLGKC